MKLRTALAACLLALAAAPAAHAYAPLEMGIHDPGATEGAELPAQRVAEAGASISRTTALWSAVAPNGAVKPAGFDARNPADPRYTWTAVDAFVNAAVAHGVDPLLTFYGAPNWAEGDDAADRAKRFGEPGTYHPNGQEFGDFMFAVATRYSGSFTPAGASGPLPRVKLFQIWNEANFGQYLTAKRKSDIPIYYAKLLNAGYDAVKSVSKSNIVITAGLGPYGNNGHATDVDPQVFMRSLMCLSGRGGRNLRVVRGCKVPTPRFDVWAQHPYTLGGSPTTKGVSPDAAAIGNMPDVARTLRYAVARRTVAPRGAKRLWATEFAWFSNPPGLVSSGGDQLGDPLPRHAANLAESAYRLWRDGFSAFVWYSLEDLNGFPSGLYSGHGDSATPKPALTAMKFPFYAEASGSRVLVWGLASRGGTSRIRIEKRSGRRWKTVATLRSDKQGMVYKRLKGGRGTYRARALTGAKAGLESLPFKARQ
jgi:hypothetical protein